MRLFPYLISLFLLAVMALSEASAASKGFCLYTGEKGVVKNVMRLSDVPEDYRSSVQCFQSAQQDVYLASPEEITLKGSVHEDTITSPVGPVHFRGARSVEHLFGRTPVRAISDAAQTLGRVLRQPGFPPEMGRLSVNWEIVFLDERLPETQIPWQLISNCHPGWMTAPSNIYIVTQKVAGGCSGKESVKSSEADRELSMVLLHEMAHVVEFNMLGAEFAGDRMRAEGFATWFESYAAEKAYSGKGNSFAKSILQAAEASYKQQPGVFQFRGTADDYARASAYFSAIVDRRGIRGLMDVYGAMRSKHCDFFEGVKISLGWKRAKLDEEVLRLFR